MTVNKSIFALPTERIIPTKIKAQYEVEEEIKPAMTGTRRMSVGYYKNPTF